MGKVTWYFSRLVSMSPSEIGYRILQRARIKEDRRLISKPYLSNSSTDKVNGWVRYQQERDTNFFFRWQDRNSLVQLMSDNFPLGKQATLTIANDLLDHRFEFFGRSFQFGTFIPWQCDPITGRNWPEKFWADIDIRDGEIYGGVKWVWEINRHHHLVTLAKAYFLSGDERFANEVCAQLDDWIKNNPPAIGINWTSPLEMAIRIINWSWALAFIRSSAALTCSLFSTIQRSIAEQANHIARYLSAYSSANNHLIGEAAGLVFAGFCFPWLVEAERWREKGIATLTQEIQRQIHSDGLPAEQATHYLEFILDFYLLTWRLLELNGISVPIIWGNRLEAASNFIRHIVDENGNIPSIGDSDNARVVPLNDFPKANNFLSILASAAVILKHPGFKSAAKGWDEKSHWLLGERGQEAFDSLPLTNKYVQSTAFRKGGYCVMRVPGRVLGFDIGPLGYLSTAAHGHADALSLYLSVNGQPVLIDPGTFAYQEGGKWRDFFRGTAAHNTIMVDLQNQSEIQGTFLWGQKAKAYLERWESNDKYDLAIAYHDGYRKLGVIHRRSVLYYKSDLILVKDVLEGSGWHQFSQLWHLPIDSEVSPGSLAFEIRSERNRLYILPLHDNLTSSDLYYGHQDPIQGWVSPHYGEIVPAPVISFSAQCDFPVSILTAIFIPLGSSEFSPGELLQRIDNYKNLLEVG